jgi:hypothetical protein
MVKYELEIEDIDEPRNKADGFVVDFALSKDGQYMMGVSRVIYLEKGQSIHSKDTQDKLVKETLKMLKGIGAK